MFIKTFYKIKNDPQLRETVSVLINKHTVEQQK